VNSTWFLFIISAQSMLRRKPTVYTRALARAVEVAGGPENLARFLGSTPSEISRWGSGETNPPMPIFLALVDVVAANALTPVALENLPSARARLSSAVTRAGFRLP
jgi:hypothetical protein